MLTPPLDSSDHVAGPYDAPLELVMYGDFQCPYCTAAQSIVRRVRERLDGRLRFVFRHLPLTEVHPDAQRAAEAAEAAAAQGSFWEMHDALYADGGRLGERDLARLADRIGLDVNRFRAELADGAYAARWRATPARHAPRAWPRRPRSSSTAGAIRTPSTPVPWSTRSRPIHRPATNLASPCTVSPRRSSSCSRRSPLPVEAASRTRSP